LDGEITPSDRAAAEAIIQGSLPSSTSRPHPSLPSPAPSNITPTLQVELDRLAAGDSVKTPGIDLARYEPAELSAVLSALTASSKRANGISKLTLSDGVTQVTPKSLNDILGQAYSSHTYVAGRTSHLALLEQYGKNAWLIGNAGLEQILAGLERELAALKTESDGLNRARREAQEAARGEMEGLQAEWRAGVGRAVEAEIAGEEMLEQIMQTRRAKMAQ
jgi:pre-mRNA-splicing factor SPF27